MMKKIFYWTAFCLIFGVILFTQCEKDDAEVTDSDNIRYGTSFNMCTGYCYRHIEITQSQIKFVANGYDLEGTLPEIVCSQDITVAEWDALNSKVDLNSFGVLPEIIGCPDCADGGAEWIEISRDGETHKVTFEYGSAPNEVSSYINILRDYMPTDTNCQ
jgi:hypothetical protein